MIVIVFAIIFPDYWACDGPHWGWKSAKEIEAEAGERSDIQDVLLRVDGQKYGIGEMSVDYHTLTFAFRGTRPTFAIPQEDWYKITGAWWQSYARRHGLDANDSPCLRLVFRNTSGEVVYSGLSRDSVYRLLIDDPLW
jgi:hypothetical protein